VDGSNVLFENLSSFVFLWSICALKYFIELNINSHLCCCFLNAALCAFGSPFCRYSCPEAKRLVVACLSTGLRFMLPSFLRAISNLVARYSLVTSPSKSSSLTPCIKFSSELLLQILSSLLTLDTSSLS
jgi:hypothetical protein